MTSASESIIRPDISRLWGGRKKRKGRKRRERRREGGSAGTRERNRRRGEFDIGRSLNSARAIEAERWGRKRIQKGRAEGDPIDEHNS